MASSVRIQSAERKFKEISRAFQVLSNPDDRAHYDRYGDEQPQQQRRQHQYHHRGGPQMYADELTPEDIFNMFFGMPPRGPGGHQRRAPRHQYQRADAQLNLAQLLPFGLLLLFSLLSSLNLGDDAPYSLRPQEAYSLERTTEGMGVRYWVPEGFELSHTDSASLRKVEDRVENDNLQRVRRRCQAERNSKQKMVDAANAYQGAERTRMFEATDGVGMRWCEEKDRLEALKQGG